MNAVPFGYPMAMGDSSEVLTSAVVGVQFQITGADPADTGMPMTPVEPFDFSIDNLSFLEPGTIAADYQCP
jgi:hypothetical protein